MEAVFAQARDAESAAEELLVDDSWKPVEPEPETIAVNGNGANGHHDLFGVGPTVELVPANSLSHTGYGGNATVNGSGNGHHEEADEPQQSLFSWAEFMAEKPQKPKRRKRKSQPATISMFEWALTSPQVRLPPLLMATNEGAEYGVGTGVVSMGLSLGGGGCKGVNGVR